MYLDPKKRLNDPEAYINYLHYHDIESSTCTEDLKDWHHFADKVCQQIDQSKINKSEKEKIKLEAERIKGTNVIQRIKKRMEILGI
jgi:hypothetical protein